MRRNDIQIDTEYAATGPLAYGREPAGSARKVRFLTTDPTDIIIETYRKNAAGKWYRAGAVMAPFPGAGVWTVGYWAAIRTANDQGLDEFRVANKGKTDLVAEQFVQGEWTITYVQPAEVHRTWAEYQANRDAFAAKQRDRAIANAPEALQNAIQVAIKHAMLITDTPAKALAAVQAELQRQSAYLK